MYCQFILEIRIHMKALFVWLLRVFVCSEPFGVRIETLMLKESSHTTTLRQPIRAFIHRFSKSQSTFVSVFTIQTHKGASAANVRGVLMVKILNKCILSILVYNLFYRQTAQYFHTPVYWLSSCLQCLHEIHISKKYGFLIGRKNRLDINYFYNTVR